MDYSDRTETKRADGMIAIEFMATGTDFDTQDLIDIHVARIELPEQAAQKLNAQLTHLLVSPE